MRAIETLTLEEAERLRKTGSLKVVVFEAVPRDEPLIYQYIHRRARALMSDVIGVPFSFGDKYGFYRTNLAEVVRLEVPEMKKDEKDYALAA